MTESISSPMVKLLLTAKQLLNFPNILKNIENVLFLGSLIKGISTCLKEHCQGKPQNVSNYESHSKLHVQNFFMISLTVL